MRLTLVQLAADIDSAVNRHRIDERLAGLRPGDQDLVVFPEATMHDFGSPGHDLAAHAEPLDGRFVEALAIHARRLDATIVAGMFERTPAKPFNTVVVLGPDGSLIAAYRKIHLYDSFGYRESDRLAMPDELAPATFEVQDLTVGLLTCYDLRFPELARQLAFAGAEVLVVPAAWVAGESKVHHWRTLLTARAIENIVWVGGAAQGGDRYEGHSLVVDPYGSIVGEAGPREDEFVTADVEAKTVVEARQVNPSLANARLGLRAVTGR